MLHYITLHCNTLHYITLHCIIFHYITLHSLQSSSSYKIVLSVIGDFLLPQIFRFIFLSATNIAKHVMIDMYLTCIGHALIGILHVVMCIQHV